MAIRRRGLRGAGVAMFATAACAVAAAAAGATVPAPPMRLPEAGGAAARAGGTWLLGVRGGRMLAVPRARARAAAQALRRTGRLAWAEPDVPVRTAGYDEHPQAWARGAVVARGLQAPSPLRSVPVAVVDERVDATVPDLAGHVTFLKRGATGDTPVHGTAVASVIAAASNGGGVLGIYPGARILAYAMPEHEMGCGELVRGIDAAVAAGARVVNLSVTSDKPCYSLFAAVERAFARDVLVVGAVGNGGRKGDPITWPTGFPHVVGAGAMRQDQQVAAFSNANTTVDLVAPGTGVPVAIPPALDLDGVADGISLASGTSFAAPMVAGAAAWLRTTRPGLSAAQVAAVLRAGAKDLGRPGWDRATGYGLVSLSRSLRRAAPAPDVREPDDDIALVDGTLLPAVAPAAWSGGAARTVRGRLDQIDDPSDVLRVRIPPGATVAFSLRPGHGNPDLDVYDARATRIGRTRHLVDSSRRPGLRNDRAAVRNAGRRAATAYVVVALGRARSERDATYRLTIARRARG